MDKGKTFRDLHAETFVIPNPWDVGSAKLLSSMGFKALATTSAGHAFSRGLPDGSITFEAMIQHCREIVAATALPVSADLEKGKGDSAESAAETIFAAEAARALKRDFVFTARAENFLHGRADLDDTIRRLQAYEKAGADVLYAPGIADVASVRAVCQAVTRPVNVLAVPDFTVPALAQAGAKRISVGSQLACAAFSALERAGRELLDVGSFTFNRANTMTFRRLNELFSTEQG